MIVNIRWQRKKPAGWVHRNNDEAVAQLFRLITMQVNNDAGE
jgi:hypothetical protein